MTAHAGDHLAHLNGPATGGLIHRNRVVITATCAMETPLPGALVYQRLTTSTGTYAMVSTVLTATTAANSYVNALAAELSIDDRAQSLVDGLVEAALPKRGAKRLLARHLV